MARRALILIVLVGLAATGVNAKAAAADGIWAGAQVTGSKNKASGNGGTDCTNASLC